MVFGEKPKKRREPSTAPQDSAEGASGARAPGDRAQQRLKAAQGMAVEGTGI